VADAPPRHGERGIGDGRLFLEGERLRRHHRTERRLDRSLGHRDALKHVLRGEDSRRPPGLVHDHHRADAFPLHGGERFADRGFAAAGHGLASQHRAQRRQHAGVIERRFRGFRAQRAVRALEQHGEMIGTERAKARAAFQQRLEILRGELPAEAVALRLVAIHRRPPANERAERKAFPRAEHDLRCAAAAPYASLLHDVKPLDDPAVRSDEQLAARVVGEAKMRREKGERIRLHFVERRVLAQRLDYQSLHARIIVPPRSTRAATEARFENRSHRHHGARANPRDANHITPKDCSIQTTKP
jgi:hypothetical protein